MFDLLENEILTSNLIKTLKMASFLWSWMICDVDNYICFTISMPNLGPGHLVRKTKL